MTEWISIHALREEGDFVNTDLGLPWEISIHALREEGDTRHIGIALQLQEFLSTPSARRATSREQRVTLSFAISIHALREEGDHRI